jgi:hypothetical protein
MPGVSGQHVEHGSPLRGWLVQRVEKKDHQREWVMVRIPPGLDLCTNIKAHCSARTGIRIQDKRGRPSLPQNRRDRRRKSRPRVDVEVLWH